MYVIIVHTCLSIIYQLRLRDRTEKDTDIFSLFVIRKITAAARGVNAYKLLSLSYGEDVFPLCENQAEMA